MAHDEKSKAQMMLTLVSIGESCKSKMLAESSMSVQQGGNCPMFWDGALCWPSTTRGVLQKLKCPEYIPRMNHHEFATRLCTLNGTWLRLNGTETTYTNYTHCTRQSLSIPDHPHASDTIEDSIRIVKTVSLIGYATSLIALILALIILLSIKRLRCPRNTLHMHLFVSFLFRASMNLLKEALFSQSGGIGLPNSVKQEGNSLIFDMEHPNWECKLVVSIWQYAIVANYFWILMEGLYLFNLIFFAPFSDSSAITLYVVLGWGCPLIVVTSWVLARIYGDNTLCWTTDANPEIAFKLSYIINIPIIISVILNFALFLCIVWVLLVKLSSAVSIETRKYRYRKWAKSTLVLVPLFGVHYAILMVLQYYAKDNIEIEVIWLFCDQLFASFQGFFVSILYCLLNGEVRSELRKLWTAYWRSIEDGDRSIPLYRLSSRFRSGGGDTTCPNDCTEEQNFNDLSCYEDKRTGGKRSIPRTVVEEC